MKQQQVNFKKDSITFLLARHMKQNLGVRCLNWVYFPGIHILMLGTVLVKEI
jgi:hypothetical protein